jgi:outer membrane protein OmpA-like peptidoglycan-associated protein
MVRAVFVLLMQTVLLNGAQFYTLHLDTSNDIRWLAEAAAQLPEPLRDHCYVLQYGVSVYTLYAELDGNRSKVAALAGAYEKQLFGSAMVVSIDGEEISRGYRDITPYFFEARLKKMQELVSVRVPFALGSSTLSPAARERLLPVRKALEAGEGELLLVAAFADSVPMHDRNDTNLRLTQRRIDAIVDAIGFGRKQ